LNSACFVRTIKIDTASFSRAEELLWAYGITAPEHIDLEAIAYAQGATVRYRPLDGCAARLIGADSRAVITVNARDNPTRQRFSLAHELAHWMQDRGTGSFLCGGDDISPQNAQTRSVEASANAYASQLILPNYLFDNHLHASPMTLTRAAEIGEIFCASLTATAIKMVKRSQQPAFLVAHQPHRRDWFIRGDGFPDDLWILDELDPDTQAFSMLYASSFGMSRISEEPATRWLSGSLALSASVRSQSAKLPDGSVLTLVTLKASPRRHHAHRAR
jgi:hypothetical protein